MVGRRNRRHRKSRQLGSHQRSWLWGRNVVLETLNAGRWIPLELFCSTTLGDELRETITTAAETLEVPLEFVSQQRIGELCHARDHQGLLARMPPFPYSTLDDILKSLSDPPLLLILDSIQDPYNFGAICRTARVFGVDGIVIASGNQTGVTSQVARSSAGTVNQIEIARVESLATAVARIRSRGIRVFASAADGTTQLAEAELRGPTAFVAGNEGLGIEDQIFELCDESIRIPHAVQFDSLNAAVATGIVLYEAHRQRADADD